jgi:tetratricopeptide (TPR) repeat protein
MPWSLTPTAAFSSKRGESHVPGTSGPGPGSADTPTGVRTESPFCLLVSPKHLLNGVVSAGRFLALGLAMLFCHAGLPIIAGELPRPLREATMLLQQQRLEEARQEALAFHRAYPRHIEALLLLGRIDLAAHLLREARTWFRLASAIDARHPLVRQYQKFFAEYEHRRGFLESNPTPLPNADPHHASTWFRRGWFGPGFPLLSAPVGRSSVPPSGTMSEPVPTPPESSVASVVPVGPSQRAKEFIAHPPFFTLEPVLSAGTLGPLVRHSLARDADDALRNRVYLKAYLLYSDLVRGYPGEGAFRLGKARAAYGMGRFAETQDLLTELIRPADMANPPAEAIRKAALVLQRQAGIRRVNPR